MFYLIIKLSARFQWHSMRVQHTKTRSIVDAADETQLDHFTSHLWLDHNRNHMPLHNRCLFAHSERRL